MRNTRTKIAKKVTWIGFYANLLLTTFKISAGILGKSTAMLADGIHSLSDFITDLIVLLFINISGKERDSNHQYGHGKFETFATLLISGVLVVVGIGIFWTGTTKVYEAFQGKMIEQPSMLALYAALLSIVTKESLYWYTKKKGDQIKNSAVIANAWHHRTDALSSIGTALGISGAIFMGEQWRILDPLSGIIVSIFIIKVAYDLGIPSIHELLEQALPTEIEEKICEIIETDKEILAYHNLKTRKIGDIYAINVHIKLDNNTSFVHSHVIATKLEKRLENTFGENTITNIHTEPIDK